MDAAPGPPSPPVAPPARRVHRIATRLGSIPLVRYAAAVGLPLLALVVTRAAEETFSSAVTVLFFAAVALSSWFGGLGPGLVTTALSSFLLNYYLLPPRHDWSYGRSELIVIVAFALVATLISWLEASRQRATEEHGAALARVQAELERRSEVERALAANEARYRSIVETANEGIWLIGRDARTQFANERLAEMLGTPADRIQAGCLLDFVFPEDASAVRERLGANLDDRSQVFDCRFRRADGEELFVLAGTSPVRDGAGAITGALWLVTDVTERKRTEAALNDARERLRQAAETARIVLWEWDSVLDHVVTTDNFAEIYGQPYMEVAAQGFALVHPDDRERHLATVGRAATDGMGYHSEFRVVRPDTGAVVWIEERAHARPTDNGSFRLLGVAIDITERKIAEEQLREREAWLSAVLAQSPVGIGLTDEDGRWILTNDVMTRYVRETIPSRDPELRTRWRGVDEAGALVPPAEWPSARALRGETASDLDVQFTDDAGERRWIRVSAAPFRGGRETITGAIVVIQDIDARKRAEEALAASERRARFLVEASAILAEAIGFDAAVEQVVRLAVPGLADWCVIDLLAEDGALHRVAIVHGDPARADAADELRRRYPEIAPDAAHTAWRVLRTGQTWVDPDVAARRFVAEARDPEHLAILERLGFASELVTPLVARGRALGVLTLVHGASGRRYGPGDVELAEELARHCAVAIDNARLYRDARAAEAKVRRLFDAGVIGLLVVDAERILEANDRFLSMVGYDRADLEDGRLRWRQMTPPEYAEADARALTELDARGFCSPFEKEYLRRDGSRVPILLGAAEVQRDPVQWICCVLDLTAQKQTEQDRLDFIDAATHDLKTPLTSLKAQTQLMLRRLRRGGEVDPAAIETGLTMVEAAATRMARLIDDLVDAARLRAGQALTLTLDATDLVEIACRCVENAQQTTERHRLRLDTDERSLVGTWDGARLERVLSNLLSNAVKYSPDGGPIEVTIRREERGSQPWAVLSVGDRGLGIPPADLPHIFDRFRRGSNVGDLPGAGIGLAGVRQIVAQHGGAITATSADGEGSTFTLDLPLIPPGAISRD